MNLTSLPLASVIPAPWNPNVMDDVMHANLCRSIERYGVVSPLVVRPIGDDRYETIGGAQRLSVLRELGHEVVPVVVVDVDVANARLLSQALNRIEGEDDLGLKAESLRTVLAQISEAEVLNLLPETAQSLQDLSTLGQGDIADYLRICRESQVARLKHLTIHTTSAQLEVIEETLSRIKPQVRDSQSDNPNLINPSKTNLEGWTG